MGAAVLNFPTAVAASAPPGSLDRLDRDDAGRAAIPAALPDFSRNVYCLCGFPFDAVTVDEMVRQTVAAAGDARRFSIATPNANFLRMARGDAAFRNAVLAADRCVADGMPLLWLARLLGLPLPQRVAGAELFEQMAASAQRPLRVFFLGSTAETCRKAEQAIHANTAGLACAGAFAPGFGGVEEMSDPAILARINKARPDMLVLAIGARKGLLWLARNEKLLVSPVIANFGATINFLAGTVRRAPAGWQIAGFEWLWRIRQEPKLWRRYAADACNLAVLFFTQVLPLLTSRLWPMPPAIRFQEAQIIPIAYDEACLVGFFGAFGEANLSRVRDALTTAASGSCDLVFDMRDVSYADSAFLGLTLVAWGHQLRIGKGCKIHGAGPELQRIFARHGCGFLLSSGQLGPQHAASLRISPSLSKGA